MSNENTSAQATPKSSIVDALFDTALAWADVGLKQGKTALESTAGALAKTAQTLETIREKLAEEPKKAA
jgi:hypothetical protein